MNGARGVIQCWAVALMLGLAVAGCGVETGFIHDDANEKKFKIQMDKGLAYLNKGRPKMALPALREAHGLQPENLEVLIGLGMAYDKLGRHARALRMFQKAHTLRPTDGEISNNLGIAYMRLDQFDEAERALRRAPKDLKFDTPEESFYNLALLYKRQKRNQDMIEALETAIQHNASFLKAHLFLAAHYRSHARPEQEQQHLEAALKTDSSNLEILERLVDAHMRSGATAKAEKALARIIALAPRADAGRRASKRLSLLRR